MAPSNNWESFKKLVKLDIRSASTKMYGNSRNNIELYITVDIVDINNEKLIVDETELKRLLNLCDYVTGEKIGSDDSNEYTIHLMAASAATTLFNNLTHVKKYIYSKLDSSRTSSFSVGIDIPGVGAFDTTLHGTSTLNGPKGQSGSVFKSPKSIEIQALRPINYGLPENIKIDGGAFAEISSSLKWTSRFIIGGPYEQHYSGICQRRFVYIRPKKGATGEEEFQKSDIVYEPISNKDVNTDTIKWDTSNSVNCFSILKERPGYGKPCAVIGHAGDEKGFDLNVWYSGYNNIGIEGPFFLADKSYYYRFSTGDIDQDYFPEYNERIPKLILYKFHMPKTNTDNYGWKNVFETVSVSVTDFHGNEGKFQLIFDNNDNFDKPGRT